MSILNTAAIEAKFSKRQAIAYAKMDAKERLQYAMTFAGVKNSGLFVNRMNINSNSGYLYVIRNTNGTVLEQLRTKNDRLFNPRTEKRPTDAKVGWVGIEIECFLPKSKFGGERDCNCECTCNSDCDSCGRMTENECSGDCRDGCDCEEDFIPSVIWAIKSLKIKNVQVVSDGSLDAKENSDDYFGLEIKVLTRVGDMANLRQVCEFLSEKGAIVNKTCGLHVHLDARPMKVAEGVVGASSALTERLERSLVFLKAMLPKSRIENNPMCEDGVSREDEDGEIDRYHMINTASYAKHRTIEVRMHSGTVSLEKISNWVLLLDAIKRAPEVKSSNVDAWYASLDLSLPLRAYVTNRMAKFNPVDAQQTSLLDATPAWHVVEELPGMDEEESEIEAA
jgi:putative amidoligase enzyme